jgi:3-oxoacyl-[acyl-carrier-protein] synthase-3
VPEAYLSALAYALPERVVENDELQRENADWDMPRIAEKVGIARRHVAAPDETSADLAYAAGRRLIDAAGVDPASIDCLVFCTQTPDYLLPTTACLLQDRLGLGTHVAAFDFNQGCSGYVYGLAIAKGFIAAGLARNVLLLTGETYSKLIHPRDRTVRVLFGDAGSASLISAREGGARIGALKLGTDGSGAHNLIVPAGGFRRPHGPDTTSETTDSIGCTRTPEHLFMDGQAITTFALQRVPALIDATLTEAGVPADGVDRYVFHQANAFMNGRLRTRLKLPAEKLPMYMESVGNTVVNTIPIVLRESGGQFAAGDRVLLVGFGVGYSWGAALVDWGAVALV